MALHHVFICGHYERESVVSDGVTGDHYVFVLNGCSRTECANTDPAWLAEQYSRPGPADLSKIDAAIWDLWYIKLVAKAGLDTVDAMNQKSISKIREVAPAIIAAVLIDGYDRGEYLEKLFHFSTISMLLKHMHQFSKKPSQRPFFNFCCREVRLYVECAKRNLGHLHDAIAAAKQSETVWETNDDGYRAAYDFYETDFGKEELGLLRAAGQIGLQLLNQPCTIDVVHQGDVLMAYMKQKLGRLAPIPRPHAPSATSSTDEFEAWLKKEEAAFRAEIAKKNMRNRFGKASVKRVVKTPPMLDLSKAGFGRVVRLPQLA